MTNKQMTRAGLLCLAVNCVRALSSNLRFVYFSKLLSVNAVDTWRAGQVNTNHLKTMQLQRTETLWKVKSFGRASSVM